MKRPHQAMVCTCMWAITDFTEANAATRLLPGSLRVEVPPDCAEVCNDLVPAEMTAGSVLVFLSIPRDTAAKFPDRLVELLGYSTYNGAIGTIGTPGTYRYANSAFRSPATALGR